ncbi:MAG TPA: response regulator transcription factor [Ferruginibacter sp.]|nr:response regulator transcription factor [Ferruginibacter sp.]
MINILLADDHAMIKAGLKILIANYIARSVVDEAEDGDSAYKKCKEKDYDLIILDLNMPDTDSVGLVSNIMALKPRSTILIYSMNAEEVYAKKYFQLGVKGYLSKTSTEDEIKKALDTVLKGKRYVSPALSQVFAEDAISKKANNPFDNLSPREFEIVLLLIRGESIASICRTMNLHSSTVGTHKARIFEKLNCSNIIDINAMAKLHNVIPG